MTYCTLANLTERYGTDFLVSLTDRETPAAGVVDVSVVDQALADTDAMINGHLVGRYSLPLGETPALLVDIAQAIAIYKLHRHVAAEKITADYKDAAKRLELIAKGTIRLEVEGAEPAGGNADTVQTNDPPRDFTPDTMKSFI